MLKVGDYVTRKKYGNDILFKVDKIVNNTVYLKGVDIRLYADSSKEDLILSSFSKKKDDFDKIRELNIKDFFYIPGTILHLDADQEYIEQVVNNYMTNAIKHCEEKAGEKKIIIRTMKTGEDKIRLYVYNTGEKIPEDFINKIWGRFYKIDSSRNREIGGTGIGLALVKAIMNNYGNEYGVKNMENGVEFFADINK